MIYCKKCKIPAKETDAVCPKCKGPLSTFGGSAKPAAAGSLGAARHATATATSISRPRSEFGDETMLGLGGKIAELELAKKRNIRLSRNLGLLCLLALLALLTLLYQVYSRTVLAYAVLENIQVEQDPIYENLIKVRFDVTSPGRVAFDRLSGRVHTEKLDVIAKTGSREVTWAWPSDKATGIDFSVVYRSGLFRKSLDKHFDMTRSGVGVDIVFLMDYTSSMQPYIDSLKQNCIDFADSVRKEGVDCHLGLIGFGDVPEGQQIYVLPPTGDIREFQDHVAKLQATGGGDTPESGVEALESALGLEFRPHAKVCFVHITDADCHDPQKLPALAEQLRKRSIITYVVSKDEYKFLYQSLYAKGGSFHAIRKANFDEILETVAKQIVNTINAR